MGFFDKLFGNASGRGKPEKTGEMMPENDYWDIIDSSQKYNDQDQQLTYITKKLIKLSPKEIIGFRLRTDKLLYDTYTSEMWCAGYIMMGGCSDDAFEYFRLWIISEGKDAYYNAKQNPDSLVDFEGEGVDFDFESFWYVANEVFEEKTGEDLYEYIDEDAFAFGEKDYPKIEFNWKEEDPESMRKICPRLFDKFWEEIE